MKSALPEISELVRPLTNLLALEILNALSLRSPLSVESIATELQDLRNGITKQPEAEPARKAVRVSWRRFAALKTQQTREQLEGAAQ